MYIRLNNNDTDQTSEFNLLLSYAALRYTHRMALIEVGNKGDIEMNAYSVYWIMSTKCIFCFNCRSEPYFYRHFVSCLKHTYIHTFDSF